MYQCLGGQQQGAKKDRSKSRRAASLAAPAVPARSTQPQASGPVAGSQQLGMLRSSAVAVAPASADERPGVCRARAHASEKLSSAAYCALQACRAASCRLLLLPKLLDSAADAGACSTAHRGFAGLVRHSGSSIQGLCFRVFDMVGFLPAPPMPGTVTRRFAVLAAAPALPGATHQQASGMPRTCTVPVQAPPKHSLTAQRQLCEPHRRQQRQPHHARAHRHLDAARHVVGDH